MSINRNISITSELSLTGPKDSFIEDSITNIKLIKKRITSNDLEIINMNIGKYTSTKISILYIKSICKDKLIIKIINKLKRINIDGIIDSSYIKNNLEIKSIYPTISITERPDKSSMALLEGKVILIVDNSPYALIIPSLFFDFFHTVDDYYQKSYHTTFIRIIRLIALFISIFLPGLYISITTRNYNLVPLNLLLVLKAGRTMVPFPAYIEAIFMIISFEILKESDLRVSSSRSAISILGGIILGDAAVNAGIVSPIMIIIIAISSIAGLIFDSFEVSSMIRLLKIIILILSTILGIYGIVISFIYLIYELITLRVYDISYISSNYKDNIIRSNSLFKRRNSELSNNIIRGRI